MLKSYKENHVTAMWSSILFYIYDFKSVSIQYIEWNEGNLIQMLCLFYLMSHGVFYIFGVVSIKVTFLMFNLSLKWFFFVCENMSSFYIWEENFDIWSELGFLKFLSDKPLTCDYTKKVKVQGLKTVKTRKGLRFVSSLSQLFLFLSFLLHLNKHKTIYREFRKRCGKYAVNDFAVVFTYLFTHT